MIGRAPAIWLALCLVVLFGLFELKYRVQGLEQHLGQINRQILDNEESIHVLKAEWSYLNQPEKIDQLARKYLGLAPLSGRQYVSFADLPQRGLPAVSDAAPARPAATTVAQKPAIAGTPPAVTLVREVR